MDVNNPSANPDGTAASPYSTIAALVAANPPGLHDAGTVIMVAGGAVPYSVATGESFPIKIDPGVVIQYWDRYGELPSSLPPRAVFDGTGVPGTSTCFRMWSSSGSQASRILGYREASATPQPDTNAGFEVRNFDVAFRVDRDGSQPPNGTLGFGEVDGLAVFNCHQAVRIEVLYPDATVAIRRSLFRGSDGSTFPADRPLCEMWVHGSGTNTVQLDVEFANCDFRPSGTDLQAPMLVFEAYESGFVTGNLTLRNCSIQSEFGNPTQNVIQGAGVEALWRGGADGSLLIQDSVVQYCREGVIGEWKSQGTTGAVVIADSVFSNNGLDGNDVPVRPYLYKGGQGMITELVNAGLHLSVTDGAQWTSYQVNKTTANGNFRHGLAIEGLASAGIPISLTGLQHRWCQFSNNGTNLPDTWVNKQGHGVYAFGKDYSFSLAVENTILSGNQSSGLKVRFDLPYVPLGHDFTLTNSLLSANLAKGSVLSQGAEDVSPLTFHFLDWASNPGHSATFHLSHVTAADNASRYALALLTDVDQHWSSGSVVENSVFRNNTGLQGWDVSFYPEPDPAAANLFTRMFASTWNCSLNRLGLTAQQEALYTTARNNFYSDPQLVTYLGLGKVFPTTPTSPLIEAGRNPAVGILAKDVRGEPRPVDYPNVSGTSLYDVGAFEVQEDE